ncbi:MAG TPA: GGDEF domain-containing protein, partial [Clostridium sp.]
MSTNIKKLILFSISILIFNLFISINAFAAVPNNINEIVILDNSLNFIRNILINYRKAVFIIGGVICISLLDAFYCFLVKAKEQGKYLKELDLERERYLIVVEQLNDIIFDFDLTEKKII